MNFKDMPNSLFVGKLYTAIKYNWSLVGDLFEFEKDENLTWNPEKQNPFKNFIELIENGNKFDNAIKNDLPVMNKELLQIERDIKSLEDACLKKYVATGCENENIKKSFLKTRKYKDLIDRKKELIKDKNIIIKEISNYKKVMKAFFKDFGFTNNQYNKIPSYYRAIITKDFCIYTDIAYQSIDKCKVLYIDSNEGQRKIVNEFKVLLQQEYDRLNKNKEDNKDEELTK